MSNTTLEVQQAIVQQVIDVFGSQAALGKAIGIDQSAVSLWKQKGIIPTRRQREIIDISRTMHAEGQIKSVVEPNDFFELRPAATAVPDAA